MTPVSSFHSRNFISFIEEKLDRNRSSASEAKNHFNQRSKVRARAPNLTIPWISCIGDNKEEGGFTKSHEGMQTQTLLLRENRINRREETFLFEKENLLLVRINDR